MIFTTNKSPKRVLHDDDLADAIVDRILDRGRHLRLDGPSVRTKHLPPDDPTDIQEDSRISGTETAKFPEPTGRFTEDSLGHERMGVRVKTSAVRKALNLQEPLRPPTHLRTRQPRTHTCCLSLRAQPVRRPRRCAVISRP